MKDVLENAVGETLGRFGWSADRLHEHRLAELRRTLRYARDHSAFYAERLRAVDTDSATIDTLAELPVTTKLDLVEHFDRLSTRQNVTAERARRHVDALVEPTALDGDLFILATSGSTGGSALAVISVPDYAANCAELFACMMTYSRRPLPANDVAVGIAGASPAHMGAAFAMLRRELDPSGTPLTIPASTAVSSIIEQVGHAQPGLIMGFASVIVRLARAQLSGQLSINPAVVVSVGEPLPDTDAAIIRDAWDCPIQQAYGSSETGWLASTVRDGGAMIAFDDQFVIEPLDAAGRTLGHGTESARVCVTTLARSEFPLIRYEIADRLTTLPADPDTTGCAYSRIAAVDGRNDDWFTYPSAEIHPTVFRSELLRHPIISHYQVRQTRHGVDLLVVAATTPTDDDAATIARGVTEALAAAGVKDAAIDVEFVTTIERTA